MAHLKSEDLRALEQSRQKLLQLTQSIGSLKEDVLRTAPMPQWESIQNQASILAQNLQSITDHLAANADTFSRVVAYPSTNYPGRTQEGVLTMLLRKKAEPEVEGWFEEGRLTGSTEAGEAKQEDPEEIWKFASENIGPMVRKTVVKIMRDGYTKEERSAGVKDVRTGLKAPVEDEGGSEDEEEDEEEEDEDEDMDDAGESEGEEAGSDGKTKKVVIGAKSLDDMMMFMVSGQVSGNRPG